MNLTSLRQYKHAYRFLLVFLAIFSFLAGGTYFLIALIEPSGTLYVPWLAQHADFINPYIHAIMAIAKKMLECLGYIADYKSNNQLRINNYNSVTLAYQCAGIGVISLWIGFIVADSISPANKIKWILVGIGIVTIINAFRIAILLIAHYEHWVGFASISHHEFYNYVLYTLFILLILFYTKKVKHSNS